jgi:hypothetical protein
MVVLLIGKKMDYAGKKGCYIAFPNTSMTIIF